MERNRVILLTTLTVLTIVAATVVSLSVLSPRTQPTIPLVREPFVPSSPLYSEAQRVPGEVQDSLSVSGSGVAKMNPDNALVSIEIVAEAQTADRATRDAARIFEALLTSLRSGGITDDQIRSTSFNLNPVYFYPRDQPPQISGYMLSHSLTVRVSSPNLEDLGLRAGEVVDRATDAGVTRVSGISFTVSSESMRRLRNEALRNAILDAREKAEVIADALQVKLVTVASVSESVFTPVPVRDFARAEVAAPGAPPTQVLPGEFEITANVFIQYVIGK